MVHERLFPSPSLYFTNGVLMTLLLAGSDLRELSSRKPTIGSKSPQKV
jgi:hypothetical protein